MHGDHLILMKYRNHRFLYNANKTGSNTLGYEEPQVLEVFKNTLPTKLYWILFPIEDLRQAVETVSYPYLYKNIQSLSE